MTARRGGRAVGVGVGVPLLALTQVSAAAAEDGARLGHTPPALSWMEVADSRGIPVWNYEMSVDRGGITSPGKFFWSMVLDLFWQLYQSCTAVAIWFVDWVLSFGWLDAVAAPVVALAGSLQQVVDRFGLTPLLLTAAAVVAVGWMARGRWAVGVYELFTSLLVASLALGVLADPVGSVTGRDGLIMESRDLGLEIADSLAHDGQGTRDAEQLRRDVTGALVDTFVRAPAQMLNFGVVVDGGPCEQVYDEVIAAGPYGDDSDIRDAVADCDAAAGELAANPGPGAAVSAIILSPAALLVLGFALTLSGAIILAAVYALFQALKSIVTLVAGLLPGRARGALWQTGADLVMSLVVLVFAIVFLTGYLLLVQTVFAAADTDTGGGGVMRTFFFVDVLLAVGVVVFWRARRSLRRAGDRLAQVLATRPGSGPTQLPARAGIDPVRVFYQARMARGAATAVGGAAQAVGGRLAGGRDAAYQLAGAAARAAGSPAARAWSRLGVAASVAHGGAAARPAHAPPGPRAVLPPRPARAEGGVDPSGPPGGGGARARPHGSAPERVDRQLSAVRARRAVTGRLARLGARAALAAATGGGSAAAALLPGAGGSHPALTAARVARRAALAGRLTPPALPAPPAGAGVAAGPGGGSGERDRWERVVRGGQVVLLPRRPALAPDPATPAGVVDSPVPPREEPHPEPPPPPVAAVRLRAELAARRRPRALPPAPPGG